MATHVSFCVNLFFLLRSLTLYCLSSLRGRMRQGPSLTMRRYRSVSKVRHPIIFITLLHNLSAMLLLVYNMHNIMYNVDRSKTHAMLDFVHRIWMSTIIYSLLEYFNMSYPLLRTLQDLRGVPSSDEPSQSLHHLRYQWAVQVHWQPLWPQLPSVSITMTILKH